MIITRFPPSPTGYLHIGGVRTALYSWLHARQNNGKFILRIEDTDQERSTEESVQVILDGMQWLGLEYDEGPYYQTKRLQRYKEVIQQLLDEDNAYHCYCSKEDVDAMREEQRAKGLKPKYDGRCRHRTEPAAGIEPVVRFKNPLDGDVVIDDLIKGNIVISNQELDDLIIARSDGMPTYNLTVVVDDMDMAMTHVIRGDDHINNTPRQINIFKALGAELPKFAHVPMILGSDGKRMSKRHGAVGVMEYRDQGILPEALLNYLVRLGWSHGDQEIFTMQELLELFRIQDVNRAASTFNAEKLLWVNHETIKAMPLEQLIGKSVWYFQQAGIDIKAQHNSSGVFALIQERSKTMLDLVVQSQFFFNDVTDYDEIAVKKHIKAQTPEIMQHLIQGFEALVEWTPESLHQVLQSTVDALEVGFAKAAQPVRVAITGNTVSPSIDQTLAILGRDLSMQRLKKAQLFFQQVIADK